MTARQAYEYSLIENNKVQAPALLLEDYNYFFNKAIINWVNSKYNFYELNQQLTDDLRVLKRTAVLSMGLINNNNPLQKASYEAVLPRDYFHILSCICEYNPKRSHKCYNAGEPVYFKANRLTADMYGATLNNYYLKPDYKRPYFYLHSNETQPLDQNPSLQVPDKQAGESYGNYSDVTIEVRYGKNDLFVLDKTIVDYLKVPAHVELTQQQIDLDVDTSQVLEFPDYVCLEIVKELVKLVLENASDPRLQTNVPVNQTTMPPQQITKGQIR